MGNGSVKHIGEMVHDSLDGQTSARLASNICFVQISPDSKKVVVGLDNNDIMIYTSRHF